MPSWPYPSASGNQLQTVRSILISREFLPGQINLENVSFYISTSSPMSIIVTIVNKNGQLFFLDVIPEDGDIKFPAQGNRVIIPVGIEKLDGQWYQWNLDAIDELLDDFGIEFDFIAKVEIRGEEFCLGPIIVFSESDGSIEETTYLASFTNERDNIQDYGWISLNPVICEYNEFIDIETEVIDEGYVCLTPEQITQQIQLPKTPITYIGMPVGMGPFLPVTIFSQTPATNALSSLYPLNLAVSRLASQLYSTPINPGLAYTLIQSIPLYLDAQNGTPYSVKQNLLQFYDPFPTYPTRIDTSNDPAYAYLVLNDPVSNSTAESAGWIIPKPYYAP
jgi:hypothetical protein